MPNQLCIAVAQNKETFNDCRVYLYNMLDKNRDKVLNLENGSIDAIIPYYISYLENKNIHFNDVINYYHLECPTYPFWEIIKVAIVGAFKRLELKQDTNFNPF